MSGAASVAAGGLTWAVASGGSVRSRRLPGGPVRGTGTGIGTAVWVRRRGFVLAAAEGSGRTTGGEGSGRTTGGEGSGRMTGAEGSGMTGLPLVADGGPPRVSSPLGFGRPYRRGVDGAPAPLMLYLPGLDGTGWAAARQFEGLGRLFRMAALAVPADASPRCFEEAVSAAVAFLEEERAATVEGGARAQRTRVYLLGESFGGLVALSVAQRRPDLVDAVVLVNPATAYALSPWPWLGNGVLLNVPDEVYAASPFLLAPFLGNPARLAQTFVETVGGAGRSDGGPLDALGGLVGDLVGAVPSLGALADLLPKDVLRARLKALGDGCAEVLPRLGQVECPVLVVVGEDDRLIPSAEEASRLERELRHAKIVRVPGGGHTLLQESGVDFLARLIQDAGFYTRSPPGRGRTGIPLPYDPVRDFVPPTRAQVDAEMRPGTGLEFAKRLTSPVFYSKGKTGVVAGLGALAETLHGGAGDDEDVDGSGGGEWVRSRAQARPVILIGNHQTLATDLGVVVEHFLTNLRVCLRGLAHPTLFASPGRGGSGGGGGGGSLVSLFTRFGAVQVSGRSLHTLLAGGEAVLLFPGGVREAYRRKGEDYRLFWPKSPEFVRMAHKFGALVVPFAAVGADDSVRLVLDAGDVLKVPGLGAELLRRESEGPRARSTASAGDELFIPPLAIPRGPLPNRLYFLAGEPIDPSDFVDAVGVFDADACYAEVQSRLEEAIEYLLAKRRDDPYADSAARLLAEQISGRPAPGFIP